MISLVLARRRRQETKVSVLPRNTFSATDSSGTTIECWNTVAIHSRQRLTSPTRGAISPEKCTLPASGASSPDRIDTIVDLPAPFRPTSPRHWPALIVKSTPCRATVLPNRLSIPVISTSAGPRAVIGFPFFRTQSGRHPAGAGLPPLGRGAHAAVRGPVDVAPES